MRTKNIYIYTDNPKKDLIFRNKDIREKGLNIKDVFTDVSFENAKKDLNYYGWDKIRMVNSLGKEFIYENYI